MTQLWCPPEYTSLVPPTCNASLRLFTTSTSMSQPTKKRKKREKLTHDDPTIIGMLTERVEQSQRLQERIEQHMAAAVPATPHVRWGQWISSSMTEIHDSIWDGFQ